MRESRQTSSPPWRRHDLLHVAPDVWASALAHCSSLADLPLVGAWAERKDGMSIRQAAKALGMHKSKVERLRKRAMETGELP